MTAAQMLSRARNLPAISAAALKLTTLLGRFDTNNDEVVRIVKQDSVLTAKLLKACNSPALGLSGQIGSVDQAVLLLGHTQIYRMVTAVAFQGSLGTALPSYSLGANALWRHSLLAAIAGENAAESPVFSVDSSTGFTVGLLHDLGKVITEQFLDRAAMLAIREQMQAGSSRVRAERQVLGTDHAEVGSGLLHLWRLPVQIVEAVGRHHEPTLTPTPRLSALAWLANLAAHQVEQDRNTHAVDCTIIEALGFGEKLNPLVESVVEAARATQGLLVAGPHSTDCV